MTGRERVNRALTFQSPDRVPRSLWKLPGVERFRQDDLKRIAARYPEDILHPPRPYAAGQRQRGERYRKGYPATDEWGCEWHVAEEGVAGEVKEPLLKDLAEVGSLRAPYEILNGADRESVEGVCAGTECFVVAWTTVRPFERMQFLLGSEALFVELAAVGRELGQLREIVHRFFLEEVSWWCRTSVDGVMFMDDWGSQKSLLIAPDTWRRCFKPLYREYCELIHAAGKKAFFHSDGYIQEIYGDLVEVGIDALNSQLFCMDIEELGRRFRGKITFWGEIDRQRILPFATPGDVKRAVGRVAAALWSPEGGTIAQCEFGLADPVENIEAVFEGWQEVP